MRGVIALVALVSSSAVSAQQIQTTCATYQGQTTCTTNLPQQTTQQFNLNSWQQPTPDYQKSYQEGAQVAQQLRQQEREQTPEQQHDRMMLCLAGHKKYC